MSFYQRYRIKAAFSNESPLGKETEAKLLAYLLDIQNANFSCWSMKINGAESVLSEGMVAPTGSNVFECDFEDVFSGSCVDTLDEILAKLDELGNDAYGIVLRNTDYGVSYFMYGSAKAVPIRELPADDVWISGSYMAVKISMPADRWTEVLNCSADEVEEQLEDDEAAVLTTLFGTQIAEELFAGEDAQLDEVEKAEDRLSAVYSFLYHSEGLDGAAVKQMQELFGQAAARMEEMGGTIKLQQDEARDSVCTNCYISDKHYCYMEFTSEPNRLSEIKMYGIVGGA